MINRCTENKQMKVENIMFTPGQIKEVHAVARHLTGKTH